MSDVELYSPQFAADPYPFYATWREEEPIWWSTSMNAHLVSRFDDVRRALVESENFRQSQSWERGFTEALGSQPLVALDPPHHSAVRGAFTVPFRPRALEEGMTAAVEASVAEIVDALDPDRPFELNHEVTIQLAMAVVARLIGAENSPRLGRLYSAVLDSLREVRVNLADAGSEGDGRSAGSQLIEHLTETRRRGARTEGLSLITELVPADGIDEHDIVVTCANLLVAGVETTVGGVGIAIAALLRSPAALATVRADPARMLRRAFDEGLRWVSPVQMVGKQVSAPTELAGQALEPGEEVVLLLGSANRDPARYERADEYVLGRNPRDHLAFGGGIHLCLGAPLARLEARVLIGRLLERFPELDLCDEVSFGGAPSARAPRSVWLDPRAGRPVEPAGVAAG